MNYFKRIETIIIAVIILLLGLAYGMLNDKKSPETDPQQNTQDNNAAGGTQLTESENDTKAEYIFYTGQDGRTALDILKTFHSVETKSFGGVGEYVTVIDGVDAGTSHFWALYVNGGMSQVGADTYVTKDTDIIEWKLEEIK